MWRMYCWSSSALPLRRGKGSASASARPSVADTASTQPAPTAQGCAKRTALVDGAWPAGQRSQANKGYIRADERCTSRPIQKGCCKVKNGCQNGNSGPNTHHSVAEVNM